MESAYYGANLFYMIVICMSIGATAIVLTLCKIFKKCMEVFIQMNKKAQN